ncbi:hypothetical protein T265_04425 [Opisthorchis viverrini]|uniref:Uncharacterized protein n=1 Tax=Opisthorchis viverrini TaxID=6198 RepID=A0A074ZN44_OPIVI|nr:hypothetical protein T265_04425 [Opisthorchis viverrini]KER28818.1 hypothetical protein T265_04425 [Opisthorchis viverrini]
MASSYKGRLLQLPFMYGPAKTDLELMLQQKSSSSSQTGRSERPSDENNLVSTSLSRLQTTYASGYLNRKQDYIESCNKPDTILF